MWMMGYTDGGEFSNNIQDSFTNRGRLRPIMPRTVSTAATSTNPPCLFHGGDLFALNHHFAMAEQNKREYNSQQVVVSSRWNPTPEQLHSLEDLYRRGTRTPSAEQIQQITAELRRYGKIEGKNVFYWFQNHKARERQKRRRQQESPPDEQPHNNNTNDNNNGQKKESLEEANRTKHEVEQTKYWASPTNSSTISPQKALSRQGASKAAETENEAADRWVQFHDTDDAPDHLLQQRKNATWQMMHNLSCTSTHPTNLINLSIASTSVTSTIPSLVAMPNLFNQLHEPYTIENSHQSSSSSDGGVAEAQTLQLFPLLGNGHQSVNEEYNNEEGVESGVASNGVHGYQFFEFLPLKN